VERENLKILRKFAETKMENKLNFSPKIHILNQHSSILNHFLAEMRDEHTQKDPMRFRKNLERTAEITAYEISKHLSYSEINVKTPLGESEVSLISEDIVLATILRAGLPYHQGFLNYFDKAPNAYISAFRQTHKDGSFTVKVEYVSSPDLNNKVLILTDPMLATGQSMVLAYQALLRFGMPSKLHIASVLSSEAGIEYVAKNLPQADIWTGAVDAEMTSKYYIVPGLGDAGDLALGEKL